MKKILSLLISAAILAALWFSLDKDAIHSALAKTDTRLFSGSLVLLIALIFASTVRLLLLARAGGFHMTPREAVEATFVANALNMFLPGKMGDLLKAGLMAENRPDSLQGALVLGIWEKLSELALLMLLASVAFSFQGGYLTYALITGAAGLAAMLVLLWERPAAFMFSVVRPIKAMSRVWTHTISTLHGRPFQTAGILVFSAAIWIGHILQVLLMAAALGIQGDSALWLAIASRIPIAILAGLVPLTFAGIGTRDVALVVLLGPLILPENAAALGVLFWARYLVPGFLGVPLLPKFMRLAASITKRKLL